MADENQTVGVDKLESTLDALVKAAEATDLTKGGIDNSGTHGSEGQQGGGQGSMSDAGGLDDMMIGKMKAAGIPQGVINAFAAFMSAEDDDDEMFGKKTKKSEADEDSDLQKSLEFFKSGDDGKVIEDTMDVQPYLDALTTKIADRFDALGKSLTQSRTSQAELNKATAGAIAQIGKLVKSQSEVINVLGERLGMVERAPVAPPKGKTGTAEPVHKSMAGEAGKGAEQLTKSEVCSTLTYMNLEKGIRNIGDRRTAEVVGMLEAGGVYDAQTDAAVRDWLRNNPNEAERARTYQ